MSDNGEPKYPHGCTRCRFQGTILVDDREFDIYKCCGGGTFVMRWGPEGDDYFANQIIKFPVQSFHEHDRDSRIYTAALVNTAWEVASGLFWT